MRVWVVKATARAAVAATVLRGAAVAVSGAAAVGRVVATEVQGSAAARAVGGMKARVWPVAAASVGEEAAAV